MIIDAENLILGRLASFAAKKALLGEKIDIVNSEKVVITGNKKGIHASYKWRTSELGNTYKGPFISRLSDRLVRRTIRGMLPWKHTRGKEAYRRVMCYIGVPEKFKNQKFETIEDANVSKVKNAKYIYIKDLSKLLREK